MPLVLVGLLGAVMAAAQGAPAWTDPISGAWGADGETLLELRLERDGRVFGTVYLVVDDFRSRAAIEEGRFDAAARSVTLRGAIPGPDGTMVRYAIDATLDGETLDTSYDFGGNRGTVRLSRVPPR